MRAAGSANEPLSTPRLRLEPLGPEHAAALLGGLQEPAIYAYLEEGPPESATALEARFRQLATRHSPDGSEAWLNWALCLEKDSRYVGYVQATVHPDASAEIAYVLFPQSWGKGLGAEAVSAMIAHLRAGPQVRLLRARVHPQNERSIALLHRLDFQVVGRDGRDLVFEL